MSDLILFWHRKDLRVSDNVGLGIAVARSPKVVGVFCFDPGILDRDDVAPARVAYLVGCLEELQQSYQKLGGELLLIQGDPVREIPALADRLGAVAVAWNWDVEPYALQRDRAVMAALKERGIASQTQWDQLLHAPEEIRTGSGTPYTVYGPFWKNWQSRPKSAPVAQPDRLEPLTAAERDLAQAQPLPTARKLGYPWDGLWVLEPGTTAARSRLESFGQRAIEAYDPDRNFPAIEGTSGLSAALKFGAIGIRELWQASATAMELARSEEAINSIRTWQQELAWREFYQHVMYHFPELAEGAYRAPLKTFPWENNQDLFEAWCEGKTGYPIVDAAMRQLNETGWMHNRCRMIVASFLTKDLIIDWRWGEKYFMQNLVDGDLSANNGGWQWSASSGMDPKPLRIFNPASQAQKFDADGDYIRRWIPELRGLDTGSLLTGKISPIERRSMNYPAPIVDHKIQQERFKQLYKSQKS
ncbi:MAG: deoxyribodipyrimidine photolyase [Oscillatoriales cyanobacterium]|nr:MAG: deoxyribodipyrimidine photolyase [Oscillatoriales cyanobacterium]